MRIPKVLDHPGFGIFALALLLVGSFKACESDSPVGNLTGENKMKLSEVQGLVDAHAIEAIPGTRYLIVINNSSLTPQGLGEICRVLQADGIKATILLTDGDVGVFEMDQRGH